MRAVHGGVLGEIGCFVWVEFEVEEFEVVEWCQIVERFGPAVFVRSEVASDPVTAAESKRERERIAR